jgi:SAM-dependent methyltransferase
LAKIDMERLHQIQKRHATSTDRYSKYVNVERWLKINLTRVQDLGLHHSSPKAILDLGCGAGFFLFAAQHFGHFGVGLDVDDFPISNEIVDLLQVERRVWRIRAFESLPDLGRRFDLITGFSTAFNRDEDESRGWDVSEWIFLLDDLERRLQPNGKMLFEINSGKTKRYFPAEVRDLFLSRGARVEGEKVIFPGKI